MKELGCLEEFIEGENIPVDVTEGYDPLSLGEIGEDVISFLKGWYLIRCWIGLMFIQEITAG